MTVSDWSQKTPWRPAFLHPNTVFVLHLCVLYSRSFAAKFCCKYSFFCSSSRSLCSHDRRVARYFSWIRLTSARCWCSTVLYLLFHFNLFRGLNCRSKGDWMVEKLDVKNLFILFSVIYICMQITQIILYKMPFVLFVYSLANAFFLNIYPCS